MAEQEKRGKYGGIIKQARQPEDQIKASVKPENQIAREPDSRKNLSQENQTTGKPDNQATKKPEKQVNLCVKVPESWRRHWAAHSKLQGITMTDVMVEALSQKFGLPDSQQTR